MKEKLKDMNKQFNMFLAIIVYALLIFAGCEKESKPYIILRRADIQVVIINNQAMDNSLLTDHKAGYNGLASLTHTERKENIFITNYAGLNFEHIHDGTNQKRDFLLEPRNAPIQISQIDEYKVKKSQNGGAIGRISPKSG